MKDFVKFIREQGVVGLAVGFILGGAVSQLVEGLVAGIIDPLIAWGFSVNNLTQQYATLGAEGTEQAILSWGAVVVLLINLVVVSAVVYFGVKALKLDKLDKKKKK